MKYITIVISYKDDLDPLHFPSNIHNELLGGEVVGMARRNSLDDRDMCEELLATLIELRNVVKDVPEMQHQKYDMLGAKVNSLIAMCGGD